MMLVRSVPVVQVWILLVCLPVCPWSSLLMPKMQERDSWLSRLLWADASLYSHKVAVDFYKLLCIVWFFYAYFRIPKGSQRRLTFVIIRMAHTLCPMYLTWQGVTLFSSSMVVMRFHTPHIVSEPCPQEMPANAQSQVCSDQLLSVNINDQSVHYWLQPYVPWTLISFYFRMNYWAIRALNLTVFNIVGLHNIS